MRLRYLRLRDLPPLRDVRVRFGHEPVLGRKVAIRFVVGVNGSGKTRFLQALAEIFLHLERPVFPPFPVTIAYDLARENDERTIYLRHDPRDPQETILFEFDRIVHDAEIEDWEELPAQVERDVKFEVRQVFERGKLPGSGAINAMLPSAILAYTSGATGIWEEMFAPPIEATSTLPMEPDAELERPFDWNLAAETRYQRELGINLSEATGEETGSGTLSVGAASFNTTSVGQFLHPESLKLALCAAALTQAVEDFNRINQKGERWFIKRVDDAVENDKPMAGFRGTLNAVDWLYPLTIGLRIRFEPERFDNELTEQLAKLYGAATTVLPDPLQQHGRLLLFDLRRPLPDRSARDISTAAALVEALAYKEKAEPYAIFRRLQTWRSRGLLQDVTLSLRKRSLEDVLLYDWLSDGERVFLGRMSLLHLFREQPDALIILDEPETHFNDYWKRQIVDVIDDQLRYNPSEVIISTHSSIALTDVFDTEITLLKKNDENGSIGVVAPPIQTFGASPTEIMLKIFGAPDIVGQRANEFLDMVLKVAAHPAQVEAVWEMMGAVNDVEVAGDSNEDSAAIRQSNDFKRLWKLVKSLHPYEDDTRLYNVLHSIRRYTQTVTRIERIRVPDALKVLEGRLGPGYYRFEFSRRLGILESRKPRASSR